MEFPDPRRTPTLAEAITQAIAGYMLRVHTGVPGIVTRVDLVGMLVDVKPQVQSNILGSDGAPQLVPYEVVANVPIRFEGAGGFRITFPVTVGDSCELRPMESSIDAWFESNGKLDVDPQDVRRFNFQDSVAVFGLRTRANAWKNVGAASMTMGFDTGPQIVFRPTGIEIGSTDGAPPTDFALKGTSYNSALQTFLTAFSAFLTSLAAATTVANVASAATALEAPTTAFGTAAAAALSAILKIE